MADPGDFDLEGYADRFADAAEAGEIPVPPTREVRQGGWPGCRSAARLTPAACGGDGQQQ
jgi:hypothetical protein